MPLGYGSSVSVVPMRYSALQGISAAQTARGRSFESPFPYKVAPCCHWALAPDGSLRHPAVASIQRSLGALGFTDATGAAPAISGAYDARTHGAYIDASMDLQPFKLRAALALLGVPPMDPESAARILRDAVAARPAAAPRPEPPVRSRPLATAASTVQQRERTSRFILLIGIAGSLASIYGLLTRRRGGEVAGLQGLGGKEGTW